MGFMSGLGTVTQDLREVSREERNGTPGTLFG